MNRLPIEYEALLARFTEMSKRVLGNNLVGVYLHGSAVMGCFHPAKSDLDILLVVKHDIPDPIKLEFMENVVRLNEDAPAKGLELSIVKKEVCDPFAYPTPFELHFSVTHLNWFKQNAVDYVRKMKGTDKDLAAHVMITRTFGKTLYGDEIAEVFGAVREADYIDSIWYDVENAREDILENPVYVTLNLCRVLAYLKDGLVLSKKTGGEWGVKSLPEKYRGIVRSALNCYGTEDETMKGQSLESQASGDQTANVQASEDKIWADSRIAVQFAAHVLAEIDGRIVREQI